MNILFASSLCIILVFPVMLKIVVLRNIIITCYVSNICANNFTQGAVTRLIKHIEKGTKDGNSLHRRAESLHCQKSW